MKELSLILRSVKYIITWILCVIGVCMFEALSRFLIYHQDITRMCGDPSWATVFILTLATIILILHFLRKIIK